MRCRLYVSFCEQNAEELQKEFECRLGAIVCFYFHSVQESIVLCITN